MPNGDNQSPLDVAVRYARFRLMIVSKELSELDEARQRLVDELNSLSEMIDGATRDT